VIIFATSVPSTFVPRQLGPYDKVVHFGMYAVLAALVTSAIAHKQGLVKAVAVTVIAVAAFGAVDEWHQQFIPGRSMDVMDWVADSIGGIIGVIAASLIRPRWSKRQA